MSMYWPRHFLTGKTSLIIMMIKDAQPLCLVNLGYSFYMLFIVACLELRQSFGNVERKDFVLRQDQCSNILANARCFAVVSYI